MNSNTALADVRAASSVPAGSRWSRGAVLSMLASLQGGQIALLENGREQTLGSGDLSARVTVHHPRIWKRILLGGTLGASEGYMDGDWSCDDLTALTRIILRNQAALDRLETGFARVGRQFAKAFHWTHRNSRSGSRKNIAAHYDLSNELFELMLDPTLTYSCGVFDDADPSLEAASHRKLDLICRKLDLRPEDHVLEIGTGWGSFALHAASKYGCRVTTTTISRRQFELAQQRVREAGLADRITLLRQDYRELQGHYDKLASVEMIEAVGAEHYPVFFERCAALLRPGGTMALQAITIADQRFEEARDNVDFIKRHIFPGSCMPSVTALLQASTAASDLRLVHLEDLTRHYPPTLRAWLQNLEAHRAEVMTHLDDRGWRAWILYLRYCEAGFLERYIGLTQLVFERPGRGP
jgi:cyclopropane-fatty-acyl-phospholipid synthase